MTQGDRIKTIRIQRGLTQQQLGELCGFPDASAGVRIRQYESNRKSPNDDTLQLLSQALKVNLLAIKEFDMNCDEDIIEMLFWIEESLGIELFTINQSQEKGDTLEYEGFIYKHNGQSSFPTYGVAINSETINFHIEDWYKKRVQLSNGSITLEEYKDWKWNWPNL